MITKAIVKEIIDDGYKALITIPIFSGSLDDKEGNSLVYNAQAIICSTNNISNLIRPNDVVIVGFENDDISKPIILGQLYRKDINLEGEIRIGINASTLSTSSTTTLNKDTYIGDVTPENIEGLIGLKCNIQEEIDKIKQNIGMV